MNNLLSIREAIETINDKEKANEVFGLHEVHFMDAYGFLEDNGFVLKVAPDLMNRMRLFIQDLSQLQISEPLLKVMLSGNPSDACRIQDLRYSEHEFALLDVVAFFLLATHWPRDYDLEEEDINMDKWLRALKLSYDRIPP